MLRIRKPDAELNQALREAKHGQVDGPGILLLPFGLRGVFIPRGFAHDHSRTRLGRGAQVFELAKRSFRCWEMFNLGWVRVANPEAKIAIGMVIAVEVHCAGLWSLNLSRITSVMDLENAFGFIYSTTHTHVEEGEERFLIEFDTNSDVWYDLEALSRPRHFLARIAYPFSRAMQHRFARDSHARMSRTCGEPTDTLEA